MSYITALYWFLTQPATAGVLGMMVVAMMATTYLKYWMVK